MNQFPDNFNYSSLFSPMTYNPVPEIDQALPVSSSREADQGEALAPLNNPLPNLSPFQEEDAVLSTQDAQAFMQRVAGPGVTIRSNYVPQLARLINHYINETSSEVLTSRTISLLFNDRVALDFIHAALNDILTRSRGLTQPPLAAPATDQALLPEERALEALSDPTLLSVAAQFLPDYIVNGLRSGYVRISFRQITNREREVEGYRVMLQVGGYKRVIAEYGRRDTNGDGIRNEADGEREILIGDPPQSALDQGIISLLQELLQGSDGNRHSFREQGVFCRETADLLYGFLNSQGLAQITFDTRENTRSVTQPQLFADRLRRAARTYQAYMAHLQDESLSVDMQRLNETLDLRQSYRASCHYNGRDNVCDDPQASARYQQALNRNYGDRVTDPYGRNAESFFIEDLQHAQRRYDLAQRALDELLPALEMADSYRDIQIPGTLAEEDFADFRVEGSDGRSTNPVWIALTSGENPLINQDGEVTSTSVATLGVADLTADQTSAISLRLEEAHRALWSSNLSASDRTLIRNAQRISAPFRSWADAILNDILQPTTGTALFMLDRSRFRFALGEYRRAQRRAAADTSSHSAQRQVAEKLNDFLGTASEILQNLRRWETVIQHNPALFPRAGSFIASTAETLMGIDNLAEYPSARLVDRQAEAQLRSQLDTIDAEIRDEISGNVTSETLTPQQYSQLTEISRALGSGPGRTIILQYLRGQLRQRTPEEIQHIYDQFGSGQAMLCPAPTMAGNNVRGAHGFGSVSLSSLDCFSDMTSFSSFGEYGEQERNRVLGLAGNLYNLMELHNTYANSDAGRRDLARATARGNEEQVLSATPLDFESLITTSENALRAISELSSTEAIKLLGILQRMSENESSVISELSDHRDQQQSLHLHQDYPRMRGTQEIPVTPRAWHVLALRYTERATVRGLVTYEGIAHRRRDMLPPDAQPGDLFVLDHHGLHRADMTVAQARAAGIPIIEPNLRAGTIVERRPMQVLQDDFNTTLKGALAEARLPFSGVEDLMTGDENGNHIFDSRLTQVDLRSAARLFAEGQYYIIEPGALQLDGDQTGALRDMALALEQRQESLSVLGSRRPRIPHLLRLLVSAATSSTPVRFTETERADLQALIDQVPQAPSRDSFASRQAYLAAQREYETAFEAFVSEHFPTIANNMMAKFNLRTALERARTQGLERLQIKDGLNEQDQSAVNRLADYLSLADELLINTDGLSPAEIARRRDISDTISIKNFSKQRPTSAQLLALQEAAEIIGETRVREILGGTDYNEAAYIEAYQEARAICYPIYRDIIANANRYPAEAPPYHDFLAFLDHHYRVTLRDRAVETIRQPSASMMLMPGVPMANTPVLQVQLRLREGHGQVRPTDFAGTRERQAEIIATLRRASVTNTDNQIQDGITWDSQLFGQVFSAAARELGYSFDANVIQTTIFTRFQQGLEGNEILIPNDFRGVSNPNQIIEILRHAGLINEINGGGRVIRMNWRERPFRLLLSAAAGIEGHEFSEQESAAILGVLQEAKTDDDIIDELEVVHSQIQDLEEELGLSLDELAESQDDEQHELVTAAGQLVAISRDPQIAVLQQDLARISSGNDVDRTQLPTLSETNSDHNRIRSYITILQQLLEQIRNISNQQSFNFLSSARQLLESIVTLLARLNVELERTQRYTPDRYNHAANTQNRLQQEFITRMISTVENIQGRLSTLIEVRDRTLPLFVQKRRLEVRQQDILFTINSNRADVAFFELIQDRYPGLFDPEDTLGSSLVNTVGRMFNGQQREYTGTQGHTDLTPEQILRLHFYGEVNNGTFSGIGNHEPEDVLMVLTQAGLVDEDPRSGTDSHLVRRFPRNLTAFSEVFNRQASALHLSFSSDEVATIFNRLKQAPLTEEDIAAGRTERTVDLSQLVVSPGGDERRNNAVLVLSQLLSTLPREQRIDLALVLPVMTLGWGARTHGMLSLVRDIPAFASGYSDQFEEAATREVGPTSYQGTEEVVNSGLRRNFTHVLGFLANSPNAQGGAMPLGREIYPLLQQSRNERVRRTYIEVASQATLEGDIVFDRHNRETMEAVVEFVRTDMLYRFDNEDLAELLEDMDTGELIQADMDFLRSLAVDETRDSFLASLPERDFELWDSFHTRGDEPQQAALRQASQLIESVLRIWGLITMSSAGQDPGLFPQANLDFAQIVDNYSVDRQRTNPTEPQRRIRIAYYPDTPEDGPLTSGTTWLRDAGNWWEEDLGWQAMDGLLSEIIEDPADFAWDATREGGLFAGHFGILMARQIEMGLGGAYRTLGHLLAALQEGNENESIQALRHLFEELAGTSVAFAIFELNPWTFLSGVKDAIHDRDYARAFGLAVGITFMTHQSMRITYDLMEIGVQAGWVTLRNNEIFINDPELARAMFEERWNEQVRNRLQRLGLGQKLGVRLLHMHFNPFAGISAVENGLVSMGRAAAAQRRYSSRGLQIDVNTADETGAIRLVRTSGTDEARSGRWIQITDLAGRASRRVYGTQDSLRRGWRGTARNLSGVGRYAFDAMFASSDAGPSPLERTGVTTFAGELTQVMMSNPTAQFTVRLANGTEVTVTGAQLLTGAQGIAANARIINTETTIPIESFDPASPSLSDPDFVREVVDNPERIFTLRTADGRAITITGRALAAGEIPEGATVIVRERSISIGEFGQFSHIRGSIETILTSSGRTYTLMFQGGADWHRGEQQHRPPRIRVNAQTMRELIIARADGEFGRFFRIINRHNQTSGLTYEEGSVRQLFDAFTPWGTVYNADRPYFTGQVEGRPFFDIVGLSTDINNARGSTPFTFQLPSTEVVRCLDELYRAPAETYRLELPPTEEGGRPREIDINRENLLRGNLPEEANIREARVRIGETEIRLSELAFHLQRNNPAARFPEALLAGETGGEVRTVEITARDLRRGILPQGIDPRTAFYMENGVPTPIPLSALVTYNPETLFEMIRNGEGLGNIYELPFRVVDSSGRAVIDEQGRPLIETHSLSGRQIFESLYNRVVLGSNRPTLGANIDAQLAEMHQESMNGRDMQLELQRAAAGQLFGGQARGMLFGRFTWAGRIYLNHALNPGYIRRFGQLLVRLAGGHTFQQPTYRHWSEIARQLDPENPRVRRFAERHNLPLQRARIVLAQRIYNQYTIGRLEAVLNTIDGILRGRIQSTIPEAERESLLREFNDRNALRRGFFRRHFQRLINRTATAFNSVLTNFESEFRPTGENFAFETQVDAVCTREGITEAARPAPPPSLQFAQARELRVADFAQISRDEEVRTRGRSNARGTAIMDELARIGHIEFMADENRQRVATVREEFNMTREEFIANELGIETTPAERGQIFDLLRNDQPVSAEEQEILRNQLSEENLSARGLRLVGLPNHPLTMAQAEHLLGRIVEYRAEPRAPQRALIMVANESVAGAYFIDLPEGVAVERTSDNHFRFYDTATNQTVTSYALDENNNVRLKQVEAAIPTEAALRQAGASEQDCSRIMQNRAALDEVISTRAAQITERALVETSRTLARRMGVPAEIVEGIQNTSDVMRIFQEGGIRIGMRFASRLEEFRATRAGQRFLATEEGRAFERALTDPAFRAGGVEVWSNIGGALLVALFAPEVIEALGLEDDPIAGMAVMVFGMHEANQGIALGTRMALNDAARNALTADYAAFRSAWAAGAEVVPGTGRTVLQTLTLERFGTESLRRAVALGVLHQAGQALRTAGNSWGHVAAYHGLMAAMGVDHDSFLRGHFATAIALTAPVIGQQLFGRVARAGLEASTNYFARTLGQKATAWLARSLVAKGLTLVGSKIIPYVGPLLFYMDIVDIVVNWGFDGSYESSVNTRVLSHLEDLPADSVFTNGPGLDWVERGAQGANFVRLHQLGPQAHSIYLDDRTEIAARAIYRQIINEDMARASETWRNVISASRSLVQTEMVGDPAVSQDESFYTEVAFDDELAVAARANVFAEYFEEVEFPGAQRQAWRDLQEILEEGEFRSGHWREAPQMDPVAHAHAVAAGLDVGRIWVEDAGERGLVNLATVSRSDVLAIFGERDTSWHRFFENPGEDNLRFRENVAQEIRETVTNPRQQGALLALLEQSRNPLANPRLREYLQTKYSLSNEQYGEFMQRVNVSFFQRQIGTIHQIRPDMVRGNEGFVDWVGTDGHGGTNGRIREIFNDDGTVRDFAAFMDFYGQELAGDLADPRTQANIVRTRRIQRLSYLIEQAVANNGVVPAENFTEVDVRLGFVTEEGRINTTAENNDTYNDIVAYMQSEWQRESQSLSAGERVQRIAFTRILYVRSGRMELVEHELEVYGDDPAEWINDAAYLRRLERISGELEAAMEGEIDESNTRALEQRNQTIGRLLDEVVRQSPEVLARELAEDENEE